MKEKATLKSKDNAEITRADKLKSFEKKAIEFTMDAFGIS